MSLSRRTVTRRIKQIDEYLANELKGKAGFFYILFVSAGRKKRHKRHGTAFDFRPRD